MIVKAITVPFTFTDGIYTSNPAKYFIIFFANEMPCFLYLNFDIDYRLTRIKITLLIMYVLLRTY